MTAATATAPRLQVRSADRLSLTVFLAVVIHALVILGVSFSVPENKPQPEELPGLEVTLVQTRADHTPQDADFLAQANQEGGGDTTERGRPTSTALPNPAQAGDAAELVPETQIPRAAQPRDPKILTSDRGDFVVQSFPSTSDIPDPNEVTTAQIIQRSKESLRLDTEIDQYRKTYSAKPRTLYFSPRTKEYKAAAYEEAWRAKVERVGNLNFPDEARRKKLSGSLRMAVAINADGSIKEIDVRQTSGQRVLDDAAIRIVRLAGPFAPFPPEMRNEYDVMIITRTWQFLADGLTTAR